MSSTSISEILSEKLQGKTVEIHSVFGDYAGTILGVYTQDAKDNRGNFLIHLRRTDGKFQEIIISEHDRIKEA